MNQAGIRAIKQALGNAGDNLYRAKLQRTANSSWRSGNDESIDDVISGYQHTVDELRVALTQAESN